MDWVWSLWGWIWPASFNVNKFKVDVKTCIIRTNLHKLKLQEQLQREKGEILQVIRSGKVEIARIKVESLIQDYRKLSAYDIIIHYCDNLLTRMELLQATGDTPSEVLSAVHTIAYASSNLNIPELQEVAGHLKAKFGYNIGNNTIESAAVWIDKKVVESLSLAPPSEEVINKYIQEFYGKVESSDIGFPVLTKPGPALQSPKPEQKPDPQHETPQQSRTIPTPYSQPFQFTPPPVATIISPSAPSPSASSPSAPSTGLYPILNTPPSNSPYPNFTPSPSSSYVDPNLLYTSPCSTIASAPFISPPPENPEFTAHEASRAHIIKMASAAARKKRTAPDSSPIKKELHGKIKKKKKVVKIKKRKSNPFQSGDPSPVKQEDMQYDSSESEVNDTDTNRSASESEENSLDLSARLEALKRGN
jgi:hypothetical protein